MKKILSLSVMLLVTFVAFAQLTVVSASDKQTIDQRENYSVRLQQNTYQLVLPDYFTEREMIINLGETRQLAIASVMVVETWIKTAKKGETTHIDSDGQKYILTKVGGGQCLVSRGEAEYQMETYKVLLPKLKKHSAFFQQVLRMPYPIGHLSASDLKRIQSKIAK